MRIATAQQMRELDRAAIQDRGCPSLALMERAAQGVVRAVRCTAGKPRGRCAVFCGTGNNGGDGLAAARLLHQGGWEVRVYLSGSWDKLTADAAEMARRLTQLGVAPRPYPAGDELELLRWCARCDAFVDALFGIGLTREITGAYRLPILLMNRFSRIPTVSADIPSGVQADTGRVLGAAVEAAATVTFTLPKAGHFVGRGGVCTGALTVWPIGIPQDLTDSLYCPAQAVDGAMVRSMLPRRDPMAHKGDFGRLHIIGGSTGYTGAPVLAAQGALRSGAGLVSLSVPESIYPITAGHCLEAMPSPLSVGPDGTLDQRGISQALRALEGKDVCLIGPGLGRSPGAEALVRRVLEESPLPMVLDADGLNAAAAHIDSLDARRDRVTVLTPHDGEFARLGGGLSHGDRLRAALNFARAHGCVLVLKGRGTVTAFPDGRAFVNTTGNCGMAKGGSGDILAGIIASLLAQGLPPERAVPAAVWLHGRAGDLAAAERGTYGMLPSDLTQYIPAAILEIMGN